MDKGKVLYTRLDMERQKQLEKMIDEYNEAFKPAIKLKSTILLEVLVNDLLKRYETGGLEELRHIIKNNI